LVTFHPAAADDRSVLWLWIIGGLLAWLIVALVVATVLGRGIRLADSRSSAAGRPLTTAALDDLAVAAAPSAAAVRRRSIPLPPVGVGLAALAVTLEAIGYATRLSGQRGSASTLLSMDAPFSIPRMFVALLFAAAAAAAVAGAGTLPGRRTWWLAVGLVGGAIAAVKAGGTLHADAMNAVTDALGGRTALVVSVAAASAVLASLWFLSRTERRDRRRVLGTLAGYAVASVGLSALSGAVPSSWYATATFLEESGEALAGVAFLVGVLAGVAPRLVLPADWALRREADAHTLELPEGLPGRSGAEGTARG
jgi:hypothetical protein